MTDILNTTIGRFEIQELIGEGAMAKVYKAYDPQINRAVAFKVLKEDLCVDEEYLSRFLREAKAAGALSHSNIVTVYDVGKINKTPYMMMELLEGKDLGDVLKEKKKMSVAETLVIGLQLAKALNYAHQSGIVHRDIKPDNIIVLPDGESIKVADFGIARMNESEEVQKTHVGSVLGTPRYMSPEQALGEEIDGRSDLFSVGVILYEMLSGAKAFDAGNIGTLMTQITQLQPEPLQKLCPGLPAGLRQIISKLLQKKPDKRFQTGGALAAALAKELASVREQEEEQRKHKYVPLKIRWSLYMSVIVAVIMLVSMTVVFTIQSRAMTSQAVDSGASFAKFIAIETAIPLLSEDWITLESFISEASSRDTFSYLIVTDRSGTIRGASDLSLVGQQYKLSESAEHVLEKDDLTTTSIELANGNKVFNINAPILFQNTEVGHIILGLSQASLEQVKSITGWLMLGLALVTISSVFVVLFIFGALLAKPLKILNRALQSYAEGHHDTRISLSRNDEIGELFTSFNKMAAAAHHTLATDEYEEIESSQPFEIKNTVETINKSVKTLLRKVKPKKSDNTATDASEEAPVNTMFENDETILASSLIELDSALTKSKPAKSEGPTSTTKSTGKKTK
ncbi:serine/threonine protein kinase [Paraglaciecola hydrolytica]|nr:serine/threonine-protein kinase [Paraglaciecola hydrolytica]